MNIEIPRSIYNEYKKIFTNPNILNTIMKIEIPFFREKHLIDLCSMAQRHFQTQDTLLKIPDEAFIVGDLHGNIHDLIRILSCLDLEAFEEGKVHIIFLGDYVDRGDYSPEVISLLFAMSVLFPNVYLLRGNHEFPILNETYGFKRDIVETYSSDTLWISFNTAFEYLPLAAVIDNQVLCVHGGIAQELKTVDQIGLIIRPICDFSNSLVCELLWNDPSTNSHNFSDSPRGCGQTFGRNAFELFRKSSKMQYLLRAHQCVGAGVESHFDSHLYTVFSSSAYDPTIANEAGFIIYSDKQFHFRHFPALTSKTKRSHAKFKLIRIVDPQDDTVATMHSSHLPQIHGSISRSKRRSLICSSLPIMHKGLKTSSVTSIKALKPLGDLIPIPPSESFSTLSLRQAMGSLGSPNPMSSNQQSSNLAPIDETLMNLDKVLQNPL